MRQGNHHWLVEDEHTSGYHDKVVSRNSLVKIVCEKVKITWIMEENQAICYPQEGQGERWQSLRQQNQEHRFSYFFLLEDQTPSSWQILPQYQWEFCCLHSRLSETSAHQGSRFHCPKDQGHLDPEKHCALRGAEKTLEKGSGQTLPSPPNLAACHGFQAYDCLTLGANFAPWVSLHSESI